jgi:hypothetical protein
MWYKPQPMIGRRLTATVLILLALQLLGGMALAADCAEQCRDEADGAGCPPVCALCTSCTHAQTATVLHLTPSMPLTAMQGFLPQSLRSISSQLTDDIFHVPLLG